MSLSVTIGPRLQMVASFVPNGANLGDIGTDHAYLPIALFETQRISKAVAIDVHEGPYQSALAAVKARHLETVIDVRFGDGLMPLKKEEVNVLTLAGMGGRTMLDILAARPDVLESVHDLILQPQGSESALRLALLKEGWRLKTERLVEEDGRIYVVMAYSKDDGWNSAELQRFEHKWSERLHTVFENEGISAPEFQRLVQKLVWHFGPLVLEERTDHLNQYMSEYWSMLTKRMEQMKKSNNTEIMVKIREVSEELALLEGLRRWQ
ncbi:SAM-dependent methyltransferase [Desulfosporosinus fructosivorans]|uniref:SAM-dependent methyltransferase n=1 Tax=Desulfosporosinus fructosivorans TaxID=2018669 RepID=A0A4Z0RBS9_9FIRM|nr:class I SAM-dependent methyltransferase [Desulfosporosinus fructosivorans]TGE39914.1 SAM-dependent methyltransferase [Desulfosporosinus fructosivorans]